MKNKKSFISFIIFILVLSNITAKDYYSEFINQMKNNNLDEAEKILKEWEKKDKKNTQINLAYFNLYVQKSLKELVIDEFAILTYTDGTQNVQEYKIPNPDLIKKAVSYIDKFIELNPDRLDAYTGKREALMAAKLYNEVVESASKMLETSIKNNNHWYWENGPYENGEEGLFIELEMTISYLVKAGFNQNQDYIKKIVEEEQKYYSESAWINEHAGLYYATLGNFEEAIFYFEKAYNIEPSYTNIINLASIYEKKLNNKEKAIEYYEKMKLLDDIKFINEAESNLNRLKK